MTVKIRPATRNDTELVYEWANDPTTRRMSFNSDPIPWESHVEWFDRVLDDPDRVLYIGEEDGPVGSVRFDRDGGNIWEVSITVAPGRRGQGLSRPLLDTACEVHGGPFVAQVKTDNEPSMRLFADWRLDTAQGGVAQFSRLTR